MQSQISGHIHAQSASLKVLNQTAAEELADMKATFAEGARVARQLEIDLREIQSRIRACQEQAKKILPVEWHTIRDGLVQDDEADSD